MVTFGEHEISADACLERITAAIDELLHLEDLAGKDPQVAYHQQEHGEFYALFVEVEIHRFARLVHRENYSSDASVDMTPQLARLQSLLAPFPVWQELSEVAFSEAERSLLRLRQFSVGGLQ